MDGGCCSREPINEGSRGSGKSGFEVRVRHQAARHGRKTKGKTGIEGARRVSGSR